MVDAPERIRPAAEDSGLSTVGAFWLLAVTAYFSRPALVAGSWGIVLIAGPSSLDTIPITIPACAGIEVRIGAALVAVGVTVAIIFGRIRSRAGMSPFVDLNMSRSDHKSQMPIRTLNGLAK